MWNSLSQNVDFSTLFSFRRSIKSVDFTKFRQMFSIVNVNAVNCQHACGNGYLVRICFNASVRKYVHANFCCCKLSMVDVFIEQINDRLIDWLIDLLIEHVVQQAVQQVYNSLFNKCMGSRRAIQRIHNILTS